MGGRKGLTGVLVVACELQTLKSSGAILSTSWRSTSHSQEELMLALSIVVLGSLSVLMAGLGDLQ